MSIRCTSDRADAIQASRKPISLEMAQRWAEQIQEELKRYCDRIEIAGSIRRRQPRVHDINVVCLPRDRQRLRERILRNRPEVILDEEEALAVMLANGVLLDVRMAVHQQRMRFGNGGSNFGSLLLWHTGPHEYNRRLMERAQRYGMAWRCRWGIYRDGQCIAAEDETDIFNALNLTFVAPDQRGKFASVAIPVSHDSAGAGSQNCGQVSEFHHFRV